MSTILIINKVSTNESQFERSSAHFIKVFLRFFHTFFFKVIKTMLYICIVIKRNSIIE